MAVFEIEPLGDEPLAAESVTRRPSDPAAKHFGERQHFAVGGVRESQRSALFDEGLPALRAHATRKAAGG